MTTMLCKKCDQRAVIRMKQHRLALCKDHYIEWFQDQTQRFIEKYRMFSQDDRILIAVSGGKDSLALWDVLWQLGYQTEGLYINLGITSEIDYSNFSEELTQKFADERNLKLNIVNIPKEHHASIPQIALRNQRGKDKPCSVCGIIKRHTMNRMTRELGFSIIATAHNLDDEVSFLFGNTLNWNIQQLSRQSPLLPEEPGFAKKVKPFCRFTERETAAYSIVRGIEYIEDECPFAEGSKQLQYKELINHLEEQQPGVKLRFYLGFLNSRESGFFPLLNQAEDQDIDLHPCPKCGQPTTSNQSCAYCHLFE